jgi:hypothetical protein
VIKQFDFSNNEPEPLKENPRDEVVPNQFLNGKQNVGSELKETFVHELIVGSQATVKTDNTKPHKRSRQKHTMLGFKNKRVGHIFSRSLRN